MWFEFGDWDVKWRRKLMTCISSGNRNLYLTGRDLEVFPNIGFLMDFVVLVGTWESAGVKFDEFVFLLNIL